MARNQTLLFCLLLGQLVLGALSAPPLVKLNIFQWLEKVPASAGKDEGCARKDAVLSTAEATKMNNLIDPNSMFGPTDGAYKTISESIANIPDGSTKRYVLTLKPGTVFREKVFIPKSKPFVTIRCDDAQNPATIVWNDSSATKGKDGKPLGIKGSSTVTIESDYFISYGVIFKNDAPAVSTGTDEAPALRVLGTKATFYNCTVDGGRNALYDEKGLHYYKSSTIMGTIDFIVGSAKSLFEDCQIFSTDMTTIVAKEPNGLNEDIIVPPGESGFSFKTCTIKGKGPLIYLGRTDTPFIFSFTEIQKELRPIIYQKGIVLTPSEGVNHYAQFKCFGRGSTTSLQYAQAKPFIGKHFISGDSWIPSMPPVDE